MGDGRSWSLVYAARACDGLLRLFHFDRAWEGTVKLVYGRETQAILSKRAMPDLSSTVCTVKFILCYCSWC